MGRQTEQQEIDRLVAAARLGAGGVLALAGEAGVGKTALLDYAAGGLEEMRVLRATGVESEREIPFAGLLQLLRPALGVLDQLPAVQAAALSSALALPQGAPDRPEGRDRFTIGAAVLSTICRYAEDGPVAVVVDDLQLIDAPSTDALLFAVRRVSADPVAVLLGVRSPEGDRFLAGLATRRLSGLDPEDARALIARARGEAVSEEYAGALHAATEGNPLALLELGGAEEAVVESIAAGLPLRVPQALVTAFGRRLAELDPECRAVLLAAAVCGTDLRLVADVCAALGLDPGRLGEAEDLDLVRVRGGQVEFRHPLLRSAAYSGASAQDRRTTHRAAADALPADDADRRAWHLAEATWAPDAEIAEFLAAAGERALARTAHSVASGAFERAALLTPDPVRRGERLLCAAEAAWSAGMGARALALLDQQPSGARELELRARIAARTGSLREALDTLLAAAESAHSADDATVFLADAVHACFYLGDARTVAALADRLEGLAGSVTAPRSRALGLMATGIAKILSGRPGAEEIRVAIPLLESVPELRDDPNRLSWLMLPPLFLRDATAGVRLRALVDEVRSAAGIGVLPAVLFHVARDQAAASAWARAEANYSEAIHLAAETGQTTELAMSLAGRCWLASRQGKETECRRDGIEARDLCSARDIHVGEVWVDYALGDLELSLGRPELAVERLTGLVARLSALGLDDADLAPGPELVDALLRLGRYDEARGVADDYREHAVLKAQPWAQARAERARGQLAPDDAMDAPFSSALGWHEQTLDRFETARTRLAYGERLRRAGRRVDARVQLRAALGEFDELGAAVWSDRAATELTATGERVRRTAVSPTAELTPQELQVSLLLADGRTTREAAAALFLSPKTVEYHLRKVYTKLGISSRAELAAALSSSG